MTDDNRHSVPVFSAGGRCEQFWHRQGCPLFDFLHQIFPLPTTASPTLRGVLNDGFGEAVVACDMPEPCKCPSLDSCQKRFLWAHREVDFAPYPVIDLVLQEGDASKFPQTLGFERLDPFLRVSKQIPCSTAIEKDEGDKRFVDLELACKADGVASPILLSLTIVIIAEAILMRTSAEQVPSLLKVAPR